MIPERIKYRDEKDNVYGVEQSARNKKWIVIRTNEGGNRKIAPQPFPTGSDAFVQKALNEHAKQNGWTEVAR